MKFILVRFTHGSGGKFLSSVLQTSNVVDHWCATLQSHKYDSYWPQLVQQYIQRSFPRQHELALRSEPHIPYCCDLYSTSRERGYDVDLDQYLGHANICRDHRLLACAHGDIYCNLVFNRPRMPKFCDGMPAVNIIVSTRREQDWLDRTLWSKHFIRTDHEIIFAPDDPDYCHTTRLPDVIRYANRSRWPLSQSENLYQDLVVNNATRDWYMNPEKFEAWDLDHSVDSYNFPLWSFFNRDLFRHHVQQVFDKFSLGEPDLELLEQIRTTWTSSQHGF